MFLVCWIVQLKSETRRKLDELVSHVNHYEHLVFENTPNFQDIQSYITSWEKLVFTTFSIEILRKLAPNWLFGEATFGRPNQGLFKSLVA